MLQAGPFGVLRHLLASALVYKSCNTQCAIQLFFFYLFIFYVFFIIILLFMFFISFFIFFLYNCKSLHANAHKQPPHTRTHNLTHTSTHPPH